MPEAKVAYCRGRFCPVEQANVNIRCKAFNYGLGAFEGIRGYWRNDEEQIYLFRVREHYERLKDSCRICRLRLSKSVDELVDITVELIRRNGHREDAYVRPIVYVGAETLSPVLPRDVESELAMWTMPLGNYFSGDSGVTAIVSSWRRVADNMIPPRAKPIAAYLNSALARADARDCGADEAIFLTQEGCVAEGSAEHLFLVRDGKLCTPLTEDDNLEGITQRTILEIVPAHLGYEVQVRHIGRTELYIADEAFFVGTGAQITPLVSIDHRPVGDGKPGPITREIRDLYARVVRNEFPEYRDWCLPVYAKEPSRQTA